MKGQTPTLQASRREKVGSRFARRVRENGGLPAIVYGHGEQPVPITINAHDALRHFHHGEKVFKLELEGAQDDQPQYVLLRDLQFDHLGTNVVHCDFSRVDLNERVVTHVPIDLIGEARGLKSAGAILMHPLESLEIECLLTNLPDVIEVDVSDLDVGQAVHAGDVKLPLPTMKLLTDPDVIVAQIVVQSAAVADAEETEVSAEQAAEPEVVGRKPKEEEEDGD
ncbi:MAG: 50S ribosomal protein L25 [Planctomycetota bacterium]|nr:MAG: 50S ribosomal protein L25 [Planctomycetota bacterium]